jgi:hypothetical protein
MKTVVSLMAQSFYTRGKTPGIHWIGGWVDPRGGQEMVAKRKILAVAGNLSPYPRIYID